MPRVVHFEVSADDPERASTFYRDVFGWRIQKWQGPEDYWLVTTGEADERGIDGGIMRRSEGFAGVINTIDVPSVDDFVARIAAHGGKIVMPKMAIPGVGYLAYCQDTEGSIFGIMESDPKAA